jgi:hypothetical protein
MNEGKNPDQLSDYLKTQGIEYKYHIRGDINSNYVFHRYKRQNIASTHIVFLAAS